MNKEIAMILTSSHNYCIRTYFSLYLFLSPSPLLFFFLFLFMNYFSNYEFFFSNFSDKDIDVSKLRVGFVTYNNVLHFYNMKVSEISFIFKCLMLSSEVSLKFIEVLKIKLCLQKLFSPRILF